MCASNDPIGYVLTVICGYTCSTGSITVQGMFQRQRRSMVPAMVDLILIIEIVFLIINNVIQIFMPVSLSHPVSRIFSGMTDTLCN